MLLLIYACFAIMNGTVENKVTILAPFTLGAIFFGGGLYLFRYLVSGGRVR